MSGRRDAGGRTAVSLRIALLLPSLCAGGAERMFTRLATCFAEAGHGVDLVLMDAGEMAYRDELSPAVRVVDLERPRFWTSQPALRRYLERERPDILVSAMPLANGMAGLAKRLARLPTKVVTTEHSAVSMAFGDLSVRRQRPVMWAIRASYRFADAVIGVSAGVTERLRNLPGVNPRKVRLIYNPVWWPGIEDRAQERVPHAWLAQSEVPVVLAAGRLESEKDFQTLLEAFAILRRKRPARLIILGEGGQRHALESCARALGIEGDFCLPGFVENPFPYMARASVFVLSSRYEGLPTVLVEAMACGTPVISTDCPSGPAEILDGRRCGPLVPVGDARALEAAIGAQIDRPTPAELLKARAREFSMQASVSAYLDLFRDLLSGPVPQPSPCPSELGMADVSVVVLSHDRKDVLRANLAELVALAEAGGCELIVVDNASTDGSPEMIEEMLTACPGARFIRNASNLGVAGGRNVGWRAATRAFVLNMDDDTYVTREAVETMLGAMHADPQLGIVSPRILHARTREAQLEVDDPRRRLANFHGACHLVRRAVIETAGLNDEGCTFGAEELDLSIRARAAGFEVGYVGDATVLHDSLARAAWEDRGRRLRWIYNFTRVHHKHFPWSAAMPFSLRNLVSHLAAGLRRHGPAFAGALLEAAWRGLRDGRRQHHAVPGQVVRLYRDPTLRPEFGNVPLGRKLCARLVR